uniref:Uncharacterized protein n=1 Tax=Plectus sambesii TaxID=2011161 RepID=A0A914XPA4_9BILA
MKLRSRAPAEPEVPQKTSPESAASSPRTPSNWGTGEKAIYGSTERAPRRMQAQRDRRSSSTTDTNHTAAKLRRTSLALVRSALLAGYSRRPPRPVPTYDHWPTLAIQQLHHRLHDYTDYRQTAGRDIYSEGENKTRAYWRRDTAPTADSTKWTTGRRDSGGVSRADGSHRRGEKLVGWRVVDWKQKRVRSPRHHRHFRIDSPTERSPTAPPIERMRRPTIGNTNTEHVDDSEIIPTGLAIEKTRLFRPRVCSVACLLLRHVQTDRHQQRRRSHPSAAKQSTEHAAEYNWLLRACAKAAIERRHANRGVVPSSSGRTKTDAEVMERGGIEINAQR